MKTKYWINEAKNAFYVISFFVGMVLAMKYAGTIDDVIKALKSLW